MYCGFSVLVSNHENTIVFSSSYQAQSEEALEYLDTNIRCGSTLPLVSGGVSKGLSIKEFPRRTFTTDSVEVIRDLGDSYAELRIESRIDGEFTHFWTRTGSTGLPGNEGTIPFIIYLSRFSPSQIPIEEKLLLSRPEFNIAAPYIYTDLDWITSISSSYTFADISFEAYVIAKVQAVVDYITDAYNDPPIIIYGEEWGSVLGREVALLDDRVDLVISTKFPGDPGRLMETTGLIEGFEGDEFLGTLYTGIETSCFPGSIGSFINLTPRPHIYVGSNTPHTFYSVGQEEFSRLVKEHYREADYEKRFRYIEGPNFETTNFEELVLAVYEFIWKYEIKDSNITPSSTEPILN